MQFQFPDFDVLWPQLVALLFGYLLGSIPFGLIFTRAAGLGDVRNIGSGNIGATNVLRTGNKWLAAATLAADMLKGMIAVFVALAFGLEYVVMAGVGAFLGHLFPVWLGFRGGKGIATYIGVLAALWPLGAIVFVGVWLIIAAVFRFSSLAALVASLAVPAYAAATGQVEHVYIFGFMTLLAWIKHRGNIAKLLGGTEGRIGERR
jgi:glycerol-3-phosphate acyltransferase PlsY